MRATNSGPDRAEMNIYEWNELDSSVRSNAVGGFRLKHCPESGECPVTCKWLFFQKHQHKSREVNCRQQAPVRLDMAGHGWTAIKVQVCKHLKHWSLPCPKIENWTICKFVSPLEPGVDPTHEGLSPNIWQSEAFCTYTRANAGNQPWAWQDGNGDLRIKWARLFSPLKRNRRVLAETLSWI